MEFTGEKVAILQSIFQNLHGEDLKSCRLVCKKWRDASLSKFKSEMTIVLEDFCKKVEDGSRLRTFEAFFQDFENCDDGIPLDSFKLNVPIKTNLWFSKWLHSYGPNIKNLNVVFHNSHPMFMDSFRSLIFNHIKNVETLSLIFVLSSEFSFRNYDADDFPNSTRYREDIKLSRLKRMKCIVEDATFTMQKTVKDILFDIIYSSEILESLEMNLFPCNTGILLRIPKRKLMYLKKLTLTNWKCNNFQVLEAIEKLADASDHGKIRLHSFSLECIFIHFDYTDIREVLDSRFLLKFLWSQRNFLKSLSIHHLPFSGSVVKTEDEDVLVEILTVREDMLFPKMTKLQKLSLCNSYGNVAWLLSAYPDWTELFPELKVFEYHYVIESLADIHPQLLKNLEISSSSVTEVILAVNVLVSPFLIGRTWALENMELFSLLQLTTEKFPNLEHLKLVGETTQMYWNNSQSRRDVISYFPNTLIISLLKGTGSGEIIVTEYKCVSDISIVEENNASA